MKKLYFFFNDTATTEIYTLSLHDALPISINSARVIAQVGIRRHLTRAEISSGKLSPRRVYELDRDLVANDLGGLGIDRIKIFSADPPRIIYSDDHVKIGEDASAAPNVRRALRGETVDHLTEGVDHTGQGTQTLSVYMP